MMDPAYDVPKLPAKPKVPRPKSIKGTKVTILGCGTSPGVPLLACKCRVCTSKDPRNNRLRASITIQVGDKVFLIDTAPDLRTQALREKLFWIDAVFFTHPHADHIHGIDELRSYNYLMARRIDCYGNAWTMSQLQKKFDYIFRKTQAGGGKPRIDLHELKAPKKVAGVKVTPLPCIHGRLPVLGYRIGDVAYLTDISEIPPATMKKLHGLKILIIDCLRFEPHPTHLHVNKAVAIAKELKPGRTYFTHMGHEIDYKAFSRQLPAKMEPAYDGLVIKA